MEPFEVNKSRTKPSKFSLGRLLTLKKSIIDSFSLLSRSQREDQTDTPNHSQLEESVRQSEVTSDTSAPTFTPAVEFPLNLDEEKARLDQTKTHTEEIDDCGTSPAVLEEDRCPGTSKTCISSTDARPNMDPYTIPDCDDPSFYNTIPEKGALVRPYEYPVFDGTAPSVVSSAGLCEAGQFRSLTLPDQNTFTHERRHSPVYETVGPTYPPKSYDLQKEHSDIEIHRRASGLAKGEDKQSEPHDPKESYARAAAPQRLSVDRMCQDNNTNGSPWSERSMEGAELIDYQPSSQAGDIETTSQAQNGLTRSRPMKVKMKEKGTQTEPELFDLLDCGFTSSGTHSACPDPNMHRIPDGNARKQFKHTRNVNYIGRQNNDYYNDPQITPQPSTSGRMFRHTSNDDTRSAFSSEGADSDFDFYSSVPASSVNPGAMAPNGEPRGTPVDSPSRASSRGCEDRITLKQQEGSSRSDLCGSSLDEVTRQFFLDDDALSDDVFMEEADQYKYPFWKYNDDPSPRTLDSIAENCQNVTFSTTTDYRQLKATFNPEDTCSFVGGKETAMHINTRGGKISTGTRESSRGAGNSCSSVKSDEMYAYKYDDIDEVLETFNGLSALRQTNLDENDATVMGVHDVRLKNHLQSGIAVCKDGPSPVTAQETDRCLQPRDAANNIHEQGGARGPRHDAEVPAPSASRQRNSSDNGDEVDSRFADMFDSLRKNSVQSKSRQMWRKRRSNHKRSLLAAQNRTFIDANKQSGLEDKETLSAMSNSLYTFPTDHNEQSLLPSKPLRGILKRSVLPQPVSTAERNLFEQTYGIENGPCRVQRRRARSLGVEVYPLERTEAMYCGEIRDQQYKVAKAHSPQSPVNAPDFNAILKQSGQLCPKRRSKSLTTERHQQHRDEADFYPELRDANGREAKVIFEHQNATEEERTNAQNLTPGIHEPTNTPSNDGSSMSYAHHLKGDAFKGVKQVSGVVEKLAGPKQSRLSWQSQRTCGDFKNSFPTPSPPGVEIHPREVRPITARKNSLEVYRWSTCVHWRRNLQHRQEGKPGCYDNGVVLQHVISVCPPGSPPATL
ncbi:hypothetical protein EGW08_001053 [Elysia chlorotica]|uniref:Uncharacterized protein n=1 Tax=Elysia chlorotica TaxID=188477 RepID=A0A433UBA9_ELYCH|nr:hypothetical protein EGW08_001053 [Elysia chlorotica]